MKSKGSSFGKGSSVLISTPALVCWGVICVLCLWKSVPGLAWLFLFLLVLGIVARHWGRRSIDRVEISIECKNTRLFPGQTTNLTYTIKNDKGIPLPWLELSQEMPRRDCLMPDEGFEVYTPMGTGEEGNLPDALRRLIPYVGGYETLTEESTWKANRRGVYTIGDIKGLSGDGFGLVQLEKKLSVKSRPVIAVYPRRVGVDTAPFLGNPWKSEGSGSGWMEDNTVLRGIRAYQPGDNVKHINWRVAARGQGIQLNLYRQVQPLKVHFILDGQSFCREKPEKDGTYPELEEVLGIIASLAIDLASAGVRFILTLPSSRYFSARTAGSEKAGDVGEALYLLSGYEPFPAAKGKAPAASDFGRVLHSDEEDLVLFTKSGAALPEDMLRGISADSVKIYCLEERETAEAMGYRTGMIKTLRKGETA